MKKCKTEFRWFSIMDYEKEAKYLREQHRQGWEFWKVHAPGFYHFVKCEPEDVVYQLDYNQQGIRNKDEYVQMFSDCGWEYLFDYLGYSYFRKSAKKMDGPEEIFCDDESRLDMVRRIFKGRVVPLIIIFLCVIIPQIFLQSMHEGVLSFISVTFIVLFILYLFIFIQFAMQYRRFKKKIGK